MIHCAVMCLFFFFKQKTAYEMLISDWSSDVCSSDLASARSAAPPSAPCSSASPSSSGSPTSRPTGGGSPSSSWSSCWRCARRASWARPKESTDMATGSRDQRSLFFGSGPLAQIHPAAWLAGIFLLAYPSFASDCFTYQIGGYSLILGTIALSLMMLAGYGGMVSLAQLTVAGFAGYLRSEEHTSESQ